LIWPIGENMNKKLLKLAKRREQLVATAESQRTQLAQALEVWRAPLAMADQGLAVIAYIKTHPILLAGGSAILLKILRPKRISKWLSRGWFAWSLMRKLQGKLLV
jgi:hypothetical protein